MAAIIYSRGFPFELASRYSNGLRSNRTCRGQGEFEQQRVHGSSSRAYLLALRAPHGLEFFRSPLARFRQSKRVHFVRRELSKDCEGVATISSLDDSVIVQTIKVAMACQSKVVGSK